MIRNLVTKLKQSLVKIENLAKSVQQDITNQGDAPELLFENVGKITFPFSGSISETPINASLSIKEQKIEELKALFANKNGLEITKKAMKAALKSTSTTGSKGNQAFSELEISALLII